MNQLLEARGARLATAVVSGVLLRQRLRLARGGGICDYARSCGAGRKSAQARDNKRLTRVSHHRGEGRSRRVGAPLLATSD